MSEIKYILAFDTAMGACSVALYDAICNITCTQKTELMQRGQAERLIPMIDETIKEAGINYQDIDLIVCTHGPGAFTGLRLSLAVAKTFSFSLGRPAIGVSTLESIALTASNPKHASLLVCLETKRKDYYVQTFENDLKPISQPESLSAGHIKDIMTSNKEWLLCGDAVERLLSEENYSSLFASTLKLEAPDPANIAKIGLDYFKNSSREKYLTPLYLREADVSFPKS